MMAYFLLLAALVALAFLICSLTHLNKLNIEIPHPRVIVEFVLFLIFMVISLIVLNK